MAFAAIAALGGLGAGAGAVALGQDLQGEVEAKRAELGEAEQRQGVLTTEISRYSEQISRLEGEVAALRTREAAVQEELDAAEERLRSEQEHLAAVRERLHRSIELLEERLVAIYKQGEPDVLTVILEADGFEELLERYEYLSRIENQDSEIVGEVRALEAEAQEIVERVRAAREEIAAKRAELARTRSQLEDREAALEAARGKREDSLSDVEGTIQRLEGDIGELEDKIQSQLQAAPTTTLPAGPIRGGSAGFIWPVNGPVVSPFGMRWGRLHAGVDIAVPSGTPIRAAKAGSIALAAPYGGYGNYTCINHGGGLSTCYAHQSRFAITSGSVDQGDVIGYVGCTGHCFGDHLHFEVRVNGSPVDPMGYL